MLIDTHSHLNFNVFENDRDDLIKRAVDEKIWIINVGTNYQSSKEAVRIAQKYSKGIYSAVGLHPINIKNKSYKNKKIIEKPEDILEESFDFQKYKKLLESPKVVAIGEIGLDYYYKPKTKRKLEEFKTKQKEIFINQLELSKELNLPVIFHCRLGHEDLVTIIKNFILKFELKGVIHCFCGNWFQAKRYLKLGFYLGFNGIIFKIDLKEVIKKTPLERILLETDSPYLTPPQAGKSRNEPIFLKYIAKEIAKIKNLSFEKVIQTTTQNARELFNI